MTLSKMTLLAGFNFCLTWSFFFQVSSPSAERIVRVPQDLERFKDLPMYVRYLEETAESGIQGQDGIFHLDSVEMESGYSTWKLANVKLNRQLLGKGRALNKKKTEAVEIKSAFCFFLIYTYRYIYKFISVSFILLHKCEPSGSRFGTMALIPCVEPQPGLF